MQGALEATARRLRLAVGLFLATVAVFAATASGASPPAPVCGPPTLMVCVLVAPDQADPVTGDATVSPSVDDTPTGRSFASYTVTITNQAKRTVTHVTLSDVVATIPALVDGAKLVSAAPIPPTTATCTADGAQCAFGNLASGQQVKVTITVRAPVLAPPNEADITNTATVSFDESFNDSPAADPKQDSVTASAMTHVAAVQNAAKSLVPSDTEVQLDTDPTGSDVTSPQDVNIGHARVPASKHDPITASLDEQMAPFTCPKKVICRSGAWLHADIPGTFNPALEFTLHWNKVLVPKSQSTKNLAVLHTACLTGCAIEVISARCSSANPPLSELPCLTDVVESPTEFKATVHRSSNGYMR